MYTESNGDNCRGASKAAEMARPVERKAAETAKPAKQPRAG